MRTRLMVLLISLSLVSNCAFYTLTVRPVDPTQNTTVESPVRVHLKDGSVVMFPSGLRVGGGKLTGPGQRYDVTLRQSVRVAEIPLADVVGVESYDEELDGAASFLGTVAGTAATVVGVPLLLLALFGSCPTVYSGDGTVEEAELFSTGIARLFEARDLDRLRAQADARGRVTLTIKNEALETHYINHLQLVEVRHRPTDTVLPEQDGHVVVAAAVRPVERASNRAGRDVSEILRAADERAYDSGPEAVGRAANGEFEDWIDLDVPVAPGDDAVTLVFRQRNSLLSTVLLYDVMLGRSGAAAVDWLGPGLGQVSQAVRLGRWYRERAGVHIKVLRDGVFEEVARVPDAGPISWHDVAASIPVRPGTTSARIRVAFLTDHIRIDRLAVASGVTRPEPRRIPLSRAVSSAPERDQKASQDLANSDGAYLATFPGQQFLAEFEAGPLDPGGARTFLLASQGYYTEWIRGSWIANAQRSQAFLPDDAALVEAYRRWTRERESFEARFRRARVPVR